jgi:hypothetical protein
MSNTDLVMDFIRRNPGCTDSEIRVGTGVRPHQQVNQITRRLATSTLIIRQVGADGMLHNYPGDAQSSQVTHPSSVQAVPQRSIAHRATARPSEEWKPSDLPPTGPGTLVILPCSGDKRPGGQPRSPAPLLSDDIDPAIAGELARCRAQVAAAAGIESARLMPAWQRYQGRLYQAARPALESYVASEGELIIISGGYGAILGTELIGDYNRLFGSADWPSRVVPRAIASYAKRRGLNQVVAFLAKTTGYRKTLESLDWKRLGIQLAVLSPIGGATGTTSSALGEAFAAWTHETLVPRWRSKHALGLSVTRL